MKLTIWPASRITNKKDFYTDVYEHLLKTGQESCFLKNGEMITRETCCEIIYN